MGVKLITAWRSNRWCTPVNSITLSIRNALLVHDNRLNGQKEAERACLSVLMSMPKQCFHRLSFHRPANSCCSSSPANSPLPTIESGLRPILRNSSSLAFVKESRNETPRAAFLATCLLPFDSIRSRKPTLTPTDDRIGSGYHTCSSSSRSARLASRTPLDRTYPKLTVRRVGGLDSGSVRCQELEQNKCT